MTKPKPSDGTQSWDEWIHANEGYFDGTGGEQVRVSDLRARLASLPAAVPSVPVEKLKNLLIDYPRYPATDLACGFYDALRADIYKLVMESEARARSGDGIPKA